MMKRFFTKRAACLLGIVVVVVVSNLALPSHFLSSFSADSKTSTQEKLHVVTTHFAWSNVSVDTKLILLRRLEILEALKANLNNPAVEAVYLFFELEINDYLEKVQRDWRPLSVVLAGRLENDMPFRYRQAFEYANTHLSGRLVLIMNADVFLGSGWESLPPLDWFRSHQRAFALSRHSQRWWPHPDDRTMCSIFTYMSSHDAFLFAAPVPQALLDRLDFPQNSWHAENVLITELRRVGLDVRNPCETFQLLHHHWTNVRPTQSSRDACAFVPNSSFADAHPTWISLIKLQDWWNGSPGISR